jgi:hypothetical protein
MRIVTNEYYVLLIVFIVIMVELEFPGPVVEVVVVVVECSRPAAVICYNWLRLDFQLCDMVNSKIILSL